MSSLAPKSKPGIFVAQGVAIATCFALAVLFLGSAMSIHGVANSFMNAVGVFFVALGLLSCFACMFYWIEAAE